MLNLKEIITYNNQLILFILFSFLIGITSTYLWIVSNNNWSLYLSKAYNYGVTIHNNILYNYTSQNYIKKLDFSDEFLSNDNILKSVNFPSQNIITSFSLFDNNKNLAQKI